MGLTNLRFYTEEEYGKLTFIPFQGNPGLSSTGHPDSRVAIELGGWINNTQLAFTVSNEPGSASGVGIDEAVALTMDIDVTDASNQQQVTTYWSVDLGANGRTTQWIINYNVKKDKKPTGKWVFVKGKKDDDDFLTRLINWLKSLFK